MNQAMRSLGNVGAGSRPLLSFFRRPSPVTAGRPSAHLAWSRWVAFLLLTASVVLLAGCVKLVGDLESPPPPSRTEAGGSATGDSPLSPSSGAWTSVPLASAEPQTESAVLEIAPASLSFGLTKAELQLTVTNAGGGVLHWTLGVEGSSPWLHVSHRFGFLDAGASTIVTLLATRAGLSGGSYMDRVYVVSNGGFAAVPVVLEVGEDYAGPISLVIWVEGITGNTVTINGAATSSSGTITRLTWQWGEGRLAEAPQVQFPMAHTYAGPGCYPVTVTAYSSSGYQRSKTIQVVIGAGGE